MKNIWVNGCFDIVHLGHIRLLRYAKSLGDFLIVGIDGDSRIKKIKGEERPINNQSFRKEFLESLASVDRVEIFHSDLELENLIQYHKINTMVVGEEYLPDQIIGAKFVDRVERFPKCIDLSTTNLLKNASSRTT